MMLHSVLITPQTFSFYRSSFGKVSKIPRVDQICSIFAINVLLRITEMRFSDELQKVFLKLPDFAYSQYGFFRHMGSQAQICQPVSRNWIKSEAINLAADPAFKASDGWFNSFTKRWRLPLKVETKVIQNLTADYAIQIVDFMDQIRRTRLEYEQKKKLKLVFGNVDQVLFQLDMGNGTTYDFEGKREISIIRTTGVKQRFTVQLTILDSGILLPPVIVFKSRSKVPDKLVKKFENRALLYSNSTGWVTERIMLDYIDQIWLNLDINPTKEKLFLVADKFSVHQTPSVQRKVKDGGSLYQEIPAGCTGLLQPLDICISKPLFN